MALNDSVRTLVGTNDLERDARQTKEWSGSIMDIEADNFIVLRIVVSAVSFDSKGALNSNEDDPFWFISCTLVFKLDVHVLYFVTLSEQQSGKLEISSTEALEGGMTSSMFVDGSL